MEKNRKQEIVKPRQVLMYILRSDFGNSLSVIGQKLGGRDHTTVLHACEKVAEELKGDNTLLEEIVQMILVIVEEIFIEIFWALKTY